MTTGTPPSKYVKVDVSPARIARVWTGIANQLEAAPRRGWRLGSRGAALALLAGAALTLAFYVLSERQARPVWPRAALETAGDAMAVALDDGSRLELAAQTKVRVSGNEPLSLALELEHGRVDCDITPRPGRHFTVSAAGVEVRVKGTRFGVELAPARDRVEVDVSRGLVEVTWKSGAERRELAAGEHWSIDLARPAATNEPRAAASSEPTNSAAPSANSAVPSASSESVANAPPASDGASAVAPHASAPRAAPVTPGARELLDLGNAARRAGDIAGATHAYEELLSAHPTDARAGLAAFELGRLRMDRLNDVQGAISALQKAVTLAPGAGFREDAMARLVEAYAAAGALERCRSAQTAYLKSYPGGVHATAVARQCGTP